MCFSSLDRVAIEIYEARQISVKVKDDKILVSKEAFRRLMHTRLAGQRILLNAKQEENYVHFLYTGGKIDGREEAYICITPDVIII